MPQIITCPDCGRKLRVPDELVGKKVKCPDCNLKFTGGITTRPGAKSARTAPARDTDDHEQRVATAPLGKKAGRARDDDEAERPSRRKKVRRRDEEDEDHPPRAPGEDEDQPRVGSTAAERRRGWKLTLLGLNLIIYGIYTLLGTLAVALLGCMTLFLIGVGGLSTMDPDVAMGSVAGAGIGLIILYIAIGLGELAALVLQTTGHGFCMAIPNKQGTGRKPLAIATFCCICGMIVLQLMSCGAMFAFRGRGQVVGQLVSLLPLAVFIGYFFCYLLFLRAVAVAMREPDLGKQLLIFMIVVPCLAVLMPVLFCVLAMIGGVATLGVAANANSPQGTAGSVGAFFILGAICELIYVAIWIGIYIWYVVLVHRVRNAVRNYVD
jgi:hypothetical protein